jgi:hypothetical protein
MVTSITTNLKILTMVIHPIRITMMMVMIQIIVKNVNMV